MEYIHHYSSEPQDLGGGHVLTRGGHAGYHNPSDAWGAEEFGLRNCASGDRIFVRTAEQDESGNAIFDVTKAVNEKLKSLSEQKSETWISQIEGSALQLGAKVKLSGVSNNESCGCRVFYPELRGDKKPYKA